MEQYDYHEAMKLSNQLCFPLYAASRNVISLYTPYLKPLGLTYTQYIVFLALWEKDGVPVGELCEKLMLDNGTLSPLLKKMQTEGYIERTRSKEDDRVVVITLTEAGRALQEKAKDVPAKVAGCVDLPPEKAQTLYTLLYELLDNRKTKQKGATQNENRL
jgi:DNA-binding MarR family transcriptional regulator